MLVFIFTPLSYVHDPLRFGQTQIQRHFVIGQARRHSAWTWTRGTFHSSSFVNRRPVASDNKGGVWLWMPPAGFVCVCGFSFFFFFFWRSHCPPPVPSPTLAVSRGWGWGAQPRWAAARCDVRLRQRGFKKDAGKWVALSQTARDNCEAHSRMCGPEI